MAESPSPTERFVFDGDLEFRVDRPRRRMSGIVVPWGKVAFSGGRQWRFGPGSIELPADVSRVKLLREHDMRDAVGRAVEFQHREAGLWAEFQVKRGPVGDEVLADAEDGVRDGFSIGPDIGADGWEVDPHDRDVRLVHRARLVEVSNVSIPAFDDARVATVVASLKGAEVPDDQAREGDKPAATPTVLHSQDSGMERFNRELDQKFSALSDKMAESAQATQEALAKGVTDAFAAAFTRLEDTNAGDRGEAVAARYKVISEPPVYRFDGDSKQPSLVKDAWTAYDNGDHDARDRLRKFQQQQQDLVKFATVTTGTASQVIPPGYRPDLYVTQLMQERPIVALASRGTLSDATPFTIPRFVSATTATADHVQGTNPTDGTLTLDTVTVTPGAISGRFVLTREIVDAANPAIDAIAMAAMRESWNRQTEQKAYAELNVNGNVGTSRDVSLALLDTDAELLADQTISRFRDLLAVYPFTRFASPTGAVIGQLVTRNFALAQDSAGRKLLPSVGAQNAVGLGNAVQQGWFVDGLAATPAWAITQAVGDELALIVKNDDFWVWESPLLTFRFEEKSGPALIELALFGYYATKVIRPAGIASLRAIA